MQAGFEKQKVDTVQRIGPTSLRTGPGGVAMTTIASPALNARGDETVEASRHAQMAYQARAPRLPEPEADIHFGPELSARRIESPYGPTVVVAAQQDRPGSPMILLSAALLRRLLAIAQAMGPARSRRRRRRRLDIRV